MGGLYFHVGDSAITAPWTDTFENLNVWTDLDSGGTAESSIVGNKMRQTADGGTDFCKQALIYKVSGDFDVQVDYDMIQKQGSAGWGCYIACYPDDSGWSFSIQRAYNPYGDVMYSEYYRNGSWELGDIDPPVDTGKLRMLRSGTTVTTQYWNGSWVTLGTKNSWNTSDVEFRLYNIYYTSRPGTVTVDWDNFTINSGTIIVP